MKIINFGTDGWRAEIADGFTFLNVQLATQALVEYLEEKGTAQKGLAIGYDRRFQSESFAYASAEICSGAGIKTYLTDCAVPTPMLSFTVKDQNLAAGIMITASHNPPQWNGFKIKEDFGGSALPETIRSVESKIKNSVHISPSSSNIEAFDPSPAYFNKINSLVDLELIKKSPIKIIIDPMFGSSSGYFSRFNLNETEIRGKRDPLFSGITPEPLPVNLLESISFIKEEILNCPSKLMACIVLDGDGDRLAAIDSSGKFINAHNVFALLLHHLAMHRKLSGEVVKTFNVSNLIDQLCQKFQKKLTVTPIGFKYIAEKILKDDILLGGEESGGMAIRGFIPERDGMLAGLMLLELMAYEEKSLAQILDQIMEELGHFYYNRVDIRTEKAKGIVAGLTKSKPEAWAGKKVVKIETMDGLKLNFKDQSWILFRASGTEPLLRIYVEARSEEEVRQILGAGEKLLSPF